MKLSPLFVVQFFSYLSTTFTVQPQVLTWNMVFLTLGQLQILIYNRNQKSINNKDYNLKDGMCKVLWACVQNTYIRYTQTVSYTHYICTQLKNLRQG